jgi:hypothetical protein
MVQKHFFGMPKFSEKSRRKSQCYSETFPLPTHVLWRKTMFDVVEEAALIIGKYSEQTRMREHKQNAGAPTRIPRERLSRKIENRENREMLQVEYLGQVTG